VVPLWLIYDHIPSRMRPSFEDLTLSQLCYWKVTRIYSLTQGEIKSLIRKPDPQTPSHHQVVPRIIKAYLTGERIPTYLPGHWPSHYFGILPTYLPRDRFLPSELVVATFGRRSISAALPYMEAQVGCKYKGPFS
jgi:hypothetical protein